VARDDRDGLVGSAGAPQVVGEVALGLRAQPQPVDLVVLAVEVAGAGGQELAQHLERLVEALARLALVDAEARVLAPPEAAADAADDLAPGAEKSWTYTYTYMSAAKK